MCVQIGWFAILLDGFDEMGASSDSLIRKTNYLKLSPLLTGQSKIVISCRPAYFVSREELRSVFSFLNAQVGLAPHKASADGDIQPQITRYLFDQVNPPSVKA